MQINFTPEEKIQLIKRFKSLKTLKQKFKFWEEKLKMNYIFFLFLDNRYYYFSRTFQESEKVFWLKNFQIRPTSDQVKSYNLFVAEQSKIHMKKANVKIEIYDHDDLFEKFNDQLNDTVNKEKFIENEIKKIEQRIFAEDSMRKHYNTDSRPRYFLEGYKEQYFNNKEPNLELKELNYLHLYSLKNGNELAKFQKLLDKELEKSKSKVIKLDSGKKFTIKQQLIALHYLGALSKIRENDNNASKQAAFLHLLTGNSFQNFRDALSSIHILLDFRSPKRSQFEKKDLEIVYNAFTELGNKTLLKQIEADYKGQEK